MNNFAWIIEYPDGALELVRANMLSYLGGAAQFTFVDSQQLHTTWTIGERGYASITEVNEETRFRLESDWRPGTNTVPVQVRKGSTKKAAVAEIDSTN